MLCNKVEKGIFWRLIVIFSVEIPSGTQRRCKNVYRNKLSELDCLVCFPREINDLNTGKCSSLQSLITLKIGHNYIPREWKPHARNRSETYAEVSVIYEMMGGVILNIS